MLWNFINIINWIYVINLKSLNWFQHNFSLFHPYKGYRWRRLWTYTNMHDMPYWTYIIQFEHVLTLSTSSWRSHINPTPKTKSVTWRDSKSFSFILTHLPLVWECVSLPFARAMPWSFFWPFFFLFYLSFGHELKARVITLWVQMKQP